jgi:hypothetical protein
MTLIALAKTWDIDPNNVGGISQANRNDHQHTLFQIKQALTGAGELTNPMTVVLSSDGATADASDNWLAFDDLDWNTAGTPHGWIVLQMGAGGAQILWDLNNVNERLMTTLWSPADGFTGGTTSARPTATDEQPINLTITTQGWLGQNTGVGHYVVSVWGSTDGESYRVVTRRTRGSSSVASFMIMEKLTRPTVADEGGPAWNGYLMGMVYPSSTSGHCMRSDSTGSPNEANSMRIEHNGVAYGVNLGGEASGSGATNKIKIQTGHAAANTNPNLLAKKHELFPVTVVGVAGTAVQGRLGEVADMFWCNRGEAIESSGMNDGNYHPAADDADGARQLILIGQYALPWGLSEAMVLITP